MTILTVAVTSAAFGAAGQLGLDQAALDSDLSEALELLQQIGA
jgi:hypothetical protein